MENQRNMRRWFTLIEFIVSIFILSIGLIGILWAFKETFTVLNYINDSINGTYLAKNGVEEVVAVRNYCFSQYNQDGWEKFVSQYGSGTYVIKSGIGNCDQSMSGILDQPNSYEWPLNAFGEIATSRWGIYYYRKVDIHTDDTALYLKQINRTRYATGETLSLVFSAPVYNSWNLLLSLPLTQSWWALFKAISDYGTQYNIDGSSNSSFFSNLADSDTRYSKVFDFDTLTMSDGNNFNIQDSWGNLYSFEFDNNGIVSNSGAMAISFSGMTTDQSQYSLCQKINNLTFMDCRFNKIIQDNFYEKLFGVSINPPINFGSGFTFSIQGNRIDILLGSGSDIRTKDTNQYINPFYEIRSLPVSNIFALFSDISDTTSWKGVKIPDQPAIGNTNTTFWFTSLISGKVSIFMYDTSQFIEETAFSFKLGDIKRNTYK